MDVVEAVDIVKEVGAGLVAGAVDLPRHALGLERGEKLSIAALSQTLPERLRLHITPCSAISRWNASLVYWLPRSE